MGFSRMVLFANIEIRLESDFGAAASFNHFTF